MKYVSILKSINCIMSKGKTQIDKMSEKREGGLFLSGLVTFYNEWFTRSWYGTNTCPCKTIIIK